MRSAAVCEKMYEEKHFLRVIIKCKHTFLVLLYRLFIDIAKSIKKEMYNNFKRSVNNYVINYFTVN